MRKVIAVTIFEIVALVGGTVVGMTWPQLPLPVGVAILCLCALLALIGLFLLLIPNRMLPRWLADTPGADVLKAQAELAKQQRLQHKQRMRDGK